MRERSTANSTAASADNLPSNLRGNRESPRQEVADVEFILSVPPGTIPEGWTGHWFNEINVAQKLREWWCHVTDAQGVNITRNFKDKAIYLMAIETEELEKINNLREKNYRASIGEREATSFEGVEKGLLEDYTPNGTKNTSKVTKDIFD